CVKNRVVEVDVETNEIVWNYSWYDAFIYNHEVHDADRLENGNTAIIDMGNDRAFTVDRNGEILWEWYAEDHLTPGTDFYEEYGGPEREGPESDWTHMNDIDQLENGNFQLSIRNFDVLIEVDPETNEIVDVIGEPRERPDNDPILHEQHNPHRLEEWGTVIVADSGSDRVVELDVENETTVWKYGGEDQLNWPRDADRLPNGHTLITDSLNFRVIEVNESGEVVWEYSLADGDRRGIPYEADRMDLPEETGGPPGWQLNGTNGVAGNGTDTSDLGPIATFEAYAMLYMPGWVERPQLAMVVLGVIASLAIVVDFVALGVYRVLR
ncbi:MAG: aryl-sulfate sulfotransferase, partial [Halanaeroarchaeum sp.]